MSTYDAPNQQVVRADGSGPSDEGTGGQSGGTRTPDPGAASAPNLDLMTKAQLVAYASQHGVEVTGDMTKDEVRAAIDEA